MLYEVITWGRVEHPKDVVSINDEIDVVVLKVDKERERISLGVITSYSIHYTKLYDIMGGSIIQRNGLQDLFLQKML